MEVYPEILNLTTPERINGAASLNNLCFNRADYINSRETRAAYDLTKAFRSARLKALPLPATGCPLDARFLEAVFSYKQTAEACGLGRIGWNVT